MMENKIRYGLEQVHIAFLDEELTTPEMPVWKEPIHVPGAIGFSSSPQGEEVRIYADNKAYYVNTTNNGYTGELELVLFPDEIIAEMLGHTIDENGMMVESPDDKLKPFALMFQVQGDQRNRRMVYYNCQASRGGQEHSTREATITPTTETASLIMLPIEVEGKQWTKGVIEYSESNVEVFNSFFDEVKLPSVLTEPEEPEV